ncbi:Opi1-domain-containing protein, partial [Rhizodiscina lignyota]
QQERAPPPSYSSHDPESLELPSVPQHEIGSPSSNATSVTLPHLKSLGLPEHNSYTPSPPEWPDASAPSFYGGYNFSTAFPPAPHTAPRSDAGIGSPMEVSSVMSLDEQNHRASSVSMDDPDVRMAAEALSGLGNPDFARSPTSSYRSTTISVHPSTASTSTTLRQTPQAQSQEPEPLLTLLTTSHPWLGATVNGSLYAYGGAKHYSPRFVRGTAEFMERNIGSPMVNTVGFVSRQTGVDGRIRRYLGDRRLSDDGKDANGSKRRRAQTNGDVAMTSPRSDAQRMRTGSQSSMSIVESLPAYDDNRSPHYEELSPLLRAEKQQEGEPSSYEQQRQRVESTWHGQLLMTTSGLGVALSDSSLRSLKYTLSVLGRTTDEIGNLMRALKILLNEYQQSESSSQSNGQNEKAPLAGPQYQQDQRQVSAENEERSRRLAERIKSYSNTLWSLLRETVATISQYTGSALPDNAASLVRRQLMSLPQRWRTAASFGSSNPSVSSGDPSSSDSPNQAVIAANRILNFGQESLDMLSQVSLVVSGTIRSAEQWLDSMGRR